MRQRMPDERSGKTHHFVIHYAKHPVGGEEGTVELEEVDGYITANAYPDGRLGEIFIRIAKTGEETSGMMDGFAIAFSIALQSGADVVQLCTKFVGSLFTPYGPTNNPRIPKCTSLLDYVARWVLITFVKPEDLPQGLRELLHGDAGVEDVK